jgi:hypothetical protein
LIAEHGCGHQIEPERATRSAATAAGFSEAGREKTHLMGGEKMQRAMAFVGAVAIMGVTATPALADLTYQWHTLTETVNGLPVTPDATGSITLTQAAVTAGSASVASAPGAPGFATYSFNGVDAIDFGAFFGPGLNGVHYSMVNGGSLPGAPLFNANLAVVGDLVEYTGGNNSFGGFAVNLGETDAYFAVGNGATWTIGFGTDNTGACNGPQNPTAGSHCIVTGKFVAVPEASSAFVLMAGLMVLNLARLRRQKH